MSEGRVDLRSRAAAAVEQYGPCDPRTLRLRSQLADGLLALGEMDEAFSVLDAIVDDCTEQLGDRHETTLTVANNRAMKLAERGRSQGLVQLTALVPVASEVWGATDRRTLMLRSNLAAATGMAGQHQGAIDQIEALLAEPDVLDDALVHTLRTNLASWREAAGS